MDYSLYEFFFSVFLQNLQFFLHYSSSKPIPSQILQKHIPRFLNTGVLSLNSHKLIPITPHLSAHLGVTICRLERVCLICVPLVGGYARGFRIIFTYFMRRKIIKGGGLVSEGKLIVGVKYLRGCGATLKVWT